MDPFQGKELRAQRYRTKLFEFAASLLLVAAICFIFAFVFQYIVPFVIGGILAVLFLPVVRFLEKQGVKRIAAVWISMLGAGLIIFGLSTVVVVVVANQVTSFTSSLKPYFTELEDWVNHPTKLRALFLSHLPPQVAAQIQTQATHSLSGLQHWFQIFANSLLHLVTLFPDWLFIIGIALIATYFMLVQRSTLIRRFLEALPPGWDRKVPATIREMIRAFLATIRVQLIMMVLSGVLAMVAMLVLGIPDAFVLGLLFGIAGIIPIVGSAILTVPWAIGSFVVGNTPLAIKVLMIQVIITLIVHLITPKITADNVGLDTLSTLFGLYVGMKIMGFTGIFVGPVLLIGIRSLLRKHLLADLFPNIVFLPNRKPKDFDTT